MDAIHGFDRMAGESFADAFNHRSQSCPPIDLREPMGRFGKPTGSSPFTLQDGSIFFWRFAMFGHPGFPVLPHAAAHRARHAQPATPSSTPPQMVVDHSHPMAWQAHHAALDQLSTRHAGTVNPGFFSARATQNSPLRFIRSTLDYSEMPLSPIVGKQPLGNVHQVLTAHGHPTGLILVVNPSNRSNRIPREIEKLATLSEQGYPVPEILSYGHFRGHAALLMREHAPLYAAMPAAPASVPGHH
ncbi:hypothetical protein GN316_19695 [Xylophilus sp. Kf1]|nr:hypothetical protein [Xylophilus sp. Kf1]